MPVIVKIVLTEIFQLTLNHSSGLKTCQQLLLYNVIGTKLAVPLPPVKNGLYHFN